MGKPFLVAARGGFLFIEFYLTHILQGSNFPAANASFKEPFRMVFERFKVEQLCLLWEDLPFGVQ